MTATVDTTACLNCGAALNGAFCAQCGQKAAPLDPSLKEFTHELVHEVSHLDGKFFQTLRLLLVCPGFLTREQFEGRRVRYVPPIRLYLIFSVVYFAVATFAPLSGPTIGCTSCPAEKKAEIEQEMREAVVHWTPRAMFLLVPVFAGLVALAAWKAHRNYPQHLYFALHLHAVWFILGAIGGLATLAGEAVARPVNFVLGFYALTYLILSFRRAYQATVLRSILAPVVVTFVYLFLVSLTLMAIILPVAYRANVV